MELQELTKKNQEFIHIATSQLIRDGKSDQEIKELLEEVLPTIIENQKKELQLAASMAHLATGPRALQNQRTATLFLKLMTTLGSCGLTLACSF